ncbi:hypothetical protein BPTFM16_00335 [Altererythrobacter insulae]|nr:hypothetical protein BPTFM16_00335 [Altererythrobacter insulae]
MRAVIFGVAFLIASCAEPVDQAASEPFGQPSEPSLTVAVDGLPSAASYRAVDETGFVLLEDLREDGTYVFKSEDGDILETGTYDQKSPDELCFTSDEEGATEKCYDEEVDADGKWISTDRETGVKATITRIEQ